MTRALLSSGELATAHAEKLQENSCPPRRCDSAGIGGEMGSLSPVAPAQAVTLTQQERERLIPLARVADWGGLREQNSDQLPVEITITYPQGKQSYKLKASHLRAFSELFDRITGASTP